jgi:hypothetical protein
MIPPMAWIGIVLVVAALIAFGVILNILLRSSDNSKQATRRPASKSRGPRSSDPTPAAPPQSPATRSGSGTAIYNDAASQPQNTGTEIDPFGGGEPVNTGTEIDPFGGGQGMGTSTEIDPFGTGQDMDVSTEIDPETYASMGDGPLEDTEIEVIDDISADEPLDETFLESSTLEETQIDPDMRKELMRRYAESKQTGAFGYLHMAGQVYEVHTGRMIVGSLPDCDITVQGDDHIALEHLAIEAQMREKGGIVAVKPLISRGVLHNGQPLQDIALLQEGDELELSPQTHLTYSKKQHLD